MHVMVDELMLSIVRRNRVVAVAVAIPDLAVWSMYYHFAFLSLSRLTALLNCTCLRVMDRGCAACTFSFNRPLASIGNYVYFAHIIYFALGLVISDLLFAIV